MQDFRKTYTYTYTWCTCLSNGHTYQNNQYSEAHCKTTN